MAMTFTFNINPFGFGASPIEVAHMRVHSSGDEHAYTLTYKAKDGPRAITGRVSKVLVDGSRRSGHRNVLHLLRDILDDVDLQELGRDYIHVLEEVREQTGFTGRVADYPGE